MTARILHEGKKRPQPGPGSYSTKSDIEKLKVNLKQDKGSDKICGFIEESKWAAKQTPGPKFNPCIDSVTARDPTPKIIKQREESKDQRMSKITKDSSSVAPGQYETENAWKKS